MVKSILKSIVISYIVSFILLLVFALIMFYTNVSDKTVGTYVIIIYFISSLIGGISVGKSVDKRKFFWGIVVGALYFVIIFILSIVSNQNVSALNSSVLIGILISMFGGMIGGMLG